MLIPLLLQLYHYRSTERLIVDKIQEQSRQQLDLMKTGFSEMKNIVFLQWNELERSRELVDALRDIRRDADKRIESMQEVIDRSRQPHDAAKTIFALFRSRFERFPSELGRSGRWTFGPELERENACGFNEKGESYRWGPGVPNDLPTSVTWSSKLLTFIGTIRDGEALIGVRISFDYRASARFRSGQGNGRRRLGDA